MDTLLSKLNQEDFRKRSAEIAQANRAFSRHFIDDNLPVRLLAPIRVNGALRIAGDTVFVCAGDAQRLIDAGKAASVVRIEI